MLSIFPRFARCMCAQLCPTLCGITPIGATSMGYSQPGSSVHGIQARKLEWVAISYSRGFSQPRNQTHISSVSSTGRRILYQQQHLGSSYRFIIVHLFFDISLVRFWASLVAQTVENLPAIQETGVRSLGKKDLLKKEMTTHSCIFAWKIP